LTRMLKFRIIFLIILIVIGAFTYYHETTTQQSAQARAEEYAVSSWNGDYTLLAQLISGEARAESHLGQVGVAAVILNRTQNPKFPATISGVIFQPGAFESVSNGQIWASYPSRSNFEAAREALNGWDPTYGSLYFWNPYKQVSPWIWTRRITTQIGRHVFGK